MKRKKTSRFFVSSGSSFNLITILEWDESMKLSSRKLSLGIFIFLSSIFTSFPFNARHGGKATQSYGLIFNIVVNHGVEKVYFLCKFKLGACREKMSCSKYPIITRMELFTSPHQRIWVFCVKLHKEKLFWYFVWQGHIRWVMPFHQKIFRLMMKVDFSFILWKICYFFILTLILFIRVWFIEFEIVCCHRIMIPFLYIK